MSYHEMFESQRTPECPPECPLNCINYAECNCCPSCGGEDFMSDGEYEICVDCGTVTGEIEVEYA